MTCVYTVAYGWGGIAARRLRALGIGNSSPHAPCPKNKSYKISVLSFYFCLVVLAKILII
ncbi:MAG: hypothetical protein V7K98_00850 [Nostoc sp.]|uniref:hypothetical protein n=1 Tax=Nostoc sp. TaxID=1180 RepID=UPI002FF72E02